VDQAKGVLDGSRQSYTIGANDQLTSSEQYKPIIVAYHNGRPSALERCGERDRWYGKRIARGMDEPYARGYREHTAPAWGNIISVVDRIKKLLPQLQTSLPSAVKVQILTDRTATIRASVKDVNSTDAHDRARVLVIFYFFGISRRLLSRVWPFRSLSLEPSVWMYLLGYSLNNLTLMALTISTGFVVDDAMS